MAYDAIIVGGGLAGATLGKSLAEARKRVLILEREVQFKDRVRGEEMHPWGVAEAKRLGIYDVLKGSCAREVRYLELQQVGAPPQPPRDLVETSPHRVGALHFLHTDMQDALLKAAGDAGAEVVRGATANGLDGGGSVRFTRDGRSEAARARIIIGADGRRSGLRQWGDFNVGTDPDRMIIAGVLLRGMKSPDDMMSVIQNFGTGQEAIVVPLSDGRFRAYVAYHKHGARSGAPLSGGHALPRFVAIAVSAGAPQQWFDRAVAAGPLACFDAADTWVDRPYKGGVALVGDAAASNDPSYGCGLSLTLRSVRLLRDELLATDDWDAAGKAYAETQREQAASMRRITGWLTDLFFTPGEEAEQRRMRAFPHFAEDPSRVPDFIGLGPDAPSDEVARQRLYGEM